LIAFSITEEDKKEREIIFISIFDENNRYHKLDLFYKRGKAKAHTFSY
jgi:hypothetical protein